MRCGCCCEEGSGRADRRKAERMVGESEGRAVEWEKEMSVVLSRATKLHANIDSAIHRSLNDASRHCSRYDASPDLVSPGALEARSLVSIRDALEVLEEQLACLQTLQQQQREEKDATLAELEESREIFIRRLKQHRGREWKVINDALSFAGEPEPVLEKDDLTLPPYPIQLATDFNAKVDVPIYYSFARNSSVPEKASFKQVDFCDEEISDQEEEELWRTYGSEHKEKSMDHKDAQSPFVAEGCVFRALKNRLFSFFRTRVGKASGQAVLLLAGAAAVTYGRQRSAGAGRSPPFVGERLSTDFWQSPKRDLCSRGNARE